MIILIYYYSTFNNYIYIFIGGNVLKKTTFIYLMCITMIISLFTPLTLTAQASSNPTPQEQGNKRVIIDIVTDGENSLKYTYEEDGEIYKAEELYDPNSNVLNSTIYKQHKNGKYKKISELETIVEDETVTLKETKNNKTITEVIEFQDAIATIENDESVELIQPFAIIDPELGPWIYSTTINGSNKVVNYTIAGIALILTNITKLPKTHKLIASAAETIFAIETERFYYTQHVYYKYNSAGLPRAEKTTTYIYSDSRKTDKIAGPIVRETRS